jgi:hypothetical protein
MGNIECCSDRHSSRVVSKYERPDFYKNCQTSGTLRPETTPTSSGLKNSMLDSLRLSYTEEKLRDVELHLMKKYKTESQNSSTVKTRRERSNSIGSEKTNWMSIVKLERVDSIISHFVKENLYNVNDPNSVFLSCLILY